MFRSKKQETATTEQLIRVHDKHVAHTLSAESPYLPFLRKLEADASVLSEKLHKDGVDHSLTIEYKEFLTSGEQAS